jgi:adenylate cyclase
MSGQKDEKAERWSRLILEGTDPSLRWGRRVMRLLPSEPRCKLCASPFHAPVGPLMRAFGKAPWPKNPRYCSSCFKQMAEHGAGAEIECSLLFADVRGSTAMAETMRPVEFRALMNRFFEAASRILVRHDGIVDKFVGDEAIGIFIPALAGQHHARKAVDAGRELLSATGHGAGQPWLPVGVGVNTGLAFVGAVGEGEQVELTAMGDPVNVTARLASQAGKGELLVTLAAAQAAEVPEAKHERRRLVLKGKTQPTDVLVLGASD